MNHDVYQIVSFEQIGAFRLKIHFNDGTIREIDFRPVLEGEIFGPLQDPHLFSRVAIDSEAQTLIWPNGADFDPATLHDWPKYRAAMEEMASRWKASTSAR